MRIEDVEKVMDELSKINIPEYWKVVDYGYFIRIFDKRLPEKQMIGIIHGGHSGKPYEIIITNVRISENEPSYIKKEFDYLFELISYLRKEFLIEIGTLKL